MRTVREFKQAIAKDRKWLMHRQPFLEVLSRIRREDVLGLTLNLVSDAVSGVGDARLVNQFQNAMVEGHSVLEEDAWDGAVRHHLFSAVRCYLWAAEERDPGEFRRLVADSIGSVVMSRMYEFVEVADPDWAIEREMIERRNRADQNGARDQEAFSWLAKHQALRCNSEWWIGREREVWGQIANMLAQLTGESNDGASR